MIELNKIYLGDCIETLTSWPDAFVDCCVTSPPYWGLRDYGHDGQIGLEETPEKYVAKMKLLFYEVRRVLKPEGTLWLNLGDSYCGTSSKGDLVDPKYKNGRTGQKIAVNNKITGIKSKDLVGIPWMIAFELRDSGWYLRQDIIWHKPNPMPESVTDRCTKSHEYIFLMSKSSQYYFNADAIKEKVTQSTGDMKACRPHGVVRNRELAYKSKENKMRGSNITNEEGLTEGMLDLPDAVRNKRSVWTITTKPYSGAHFATFPEDLIRPCILAGCPQGGIILDPFMGAGTTALVAKKNGCKFIGCELNPAYIEIAEKRIAQEYLF